MTVARDRIFLALYAGEFLFSVEDDETGVLKAYVKTTVYQIGIPYSPRFTVIALSQ